VVRQLDRSLLIRFVTIIFDHSINLVVAPGECSETAPRLKLRPASAERQGVKTLSVLFSA
jgi:hypothetical protein